MGASELVRESNLSLRGQHMKKYVLFTIIILTLAMLVATSGCTSNKPNLTAEDYNQQGLALANQGKYKEAIDEYTKAIKLNSQDAQFYVNRGTAYLNMKEFDLAIADFDQAIKLDPNLAEAYAGRGCAYMNKGGMYLNLAISDFNIVLLKSKDADLTAYARKMLENLTQNPPLGGVIPLPPVIDIPPEPIIDNGTQEGNVNTTSAILGPWQGTFEITDTLTASSPYAETWQYESKGEFSFNMVKKSEYFIEPQGSGTIKGSYIALMPSIRIVGNFEATFQVIGYSRGLGDISKDTYLSFTNFSPREGAGTRTFTPSGRPAEIRPEGIPVLPDGGTTLVNTTLESLEFKDGATSTKEWVSRDNTQTIHIVVTIRKGG